MPKLTHSTADFYQNKEDFFAFKADLFCNVLKFFELFSILILAALTDAIIAQHASLRGIARQLAEVYYIVGAQQLDGYGQECFLARDERGTEVLIGASLTGIVIREGPSPHFYKWNDITNLVNHKRYFGIECQNYEHSIQFILDEPESAKYVWKMCKF